MKPYTIVKDFEKALCDYTGARFAVTTNSCTMALLLSCSYLKRLIKQGEYVESSHISIPKYTYCSVPQIIKHAGFCVTFRDQDWEGTYCLRPFNIWDSARRFTSGMYRTGSMDCVSFHASKILGDTQGGAILHDNPEADKWLRKARFDGRTEGVAPKDDNFEIIGYHAIMSPDVAARLLVKLSVLPEKNEDLPNDDYPDLSKWDIFKT